MEGKESRVLADMRKGLSLPIVLQWGQHMHVLLTCPEQALTQKGCEVPVRIQGEAGEG